tara:strand:- start:16533 stop:16712 length:180 start_codon:yes stop_codon:yes gene_type:complete
MSVTIVEVSYQYDGFTEERLNELIVSYSDGKLSAVPINELNKDYRAVLKWVEEGGVINE